MYMPMITEFNKMLTNLDGLMAKAAGYSDQKKFDVNVLTTARLAPDMFPFAKQVQSSCDAAKFCASYLAKKEAPKHEDNETTWAELRERIKKATTYLGTFKESDFANASAVKISPKWAEGKWLPADEYIHQLAIPNFYFHITIAYAILRENGVDVGKTDFIGDLPFNK